MRVAYVAVAAFPQESVPVTVTVALHVPTVAALFVTTPRQLSLAVVAAIAAASAVAVVE